MANQLKWMDANENISSILIEIDSPGGHVDGTATFADAIRNASTPTIALVNDGMACSAGYWIASAADTVYATHAHSEVGSIGVYATLADYAKYYEDKGIRVDDLYAKQSTEKNKGYRDWKAGNADEFINRLSATADVFINTVKTNRAGKLNLEVADPFKGAVYSADKAVEIGLIDGIKSYDAVMNELLIKEETLNFS
jgi:ClpP class serine protease